MARTTGSSVLQVAAILPCTADGRLRLRKALWKHLDVAPGSDLYLEMNREVILRPRGRKQERLPVDDKGRVSLPAAVMQKLGIGKKALVALVERPHGLAMKKLDVVEKPGARAALTDIETPYAIARIVESCPMPDELLPQLIAGYRDARLEHDLPGFLRGRQAFDAWRGRQVLGIPEGSDDALRQSLARERLDRQGDDGSWEGRVTVTARNLRELADLGLTPAAPPVGRAVEWLLARPESEHNPGMFFGSDQLVEEQAAVVEQRGRGVGGRFRKIKVSEQNLVRAGDDLVVTPCGPRIMWPNALALEALLRLGCESLPRVQRALRAMMHEWCECGYQHGTSSWQHPHTMTMEAIEALEASCIHEFRYGGVGDLRSLETADKSRVPFQFPRIGHRATANGDEYPLEMPTHIQGCEAITTRALSGVADPRMGRFAEAHLWRFASRQHAANGRFALEKYGSGLSHGGLLDIFSRYDHPAAKVAAMRALPWIVESQNRDGSWGEEPRKDAETRAVVSVIASVRDQLPAGFVA